MKTKSGGRSLFRKLLAAVLLLPGLAHAQTGTALVNGVPQGVAGDAGSIQTFYLDVPAGLSSLTVAGTNGSLGGGGYADVYVNFGEPFLTGTDPNPVAECALTISDYSDKCEILSPAAGLWYVEVNPTYFVAEEWMAFVAIAATALTDGQPLAITGTDAWFYIDVPPDQKQLRVNTIGGTGDPALYVGSGLYSLFWSAPICESAFGELPGESCDVLGPGAGRWYIAVDGLPDYSDVELLAEHGPAESTVETALSNAVHQTLAGAQGSIQTFYLDVPAGVTSLHFITAGFVDSEGDADIYVNYSEPYLASADPTAECASLNAYSDEGCEILQPAAGRWYVEVYGSTAFVDVGLIGIAATGLMNGHARTIAGTIDSRVVYFIDVPPDQEQLTVGTSGGTGNPDLHLFQLFQFPCSSTNSGTFESCQVNSPGAGRRYVVVDGITAYSGVALLATHTAPVDDPPVVAAGSGGALPASVLGVLLLAGLAARLRRRFPTTLGVAMRIKCAAIAFTALLLPVPGWSDTTPAQFTFPTFTNAEPGDLFVQGFVVTEIDEPTPISVTDGEYRIGGGAFTTSPGVVHDTQQLQVRATAGPFGQTVNLVLDIGGVQGTLSVTSRPANTDTLGYCDDYDCYFATVSTSAGTLQNVATIAIPAFALPSYAYTFSYDFGGFLAINITGLAPGDPATVTVTLPATMGPPTHYVTCDASACALFGAGITGNAVTLNLVDGGAGDADGLADGTISHQGAPATYAPPNAFFFTDAGGVDPEAVVESNVITVAGTNFVQSISVTGGEYRIGNGVYVTSAGTVTPGQTVQVRATAGPFGQTVNVVLTIGGVADSFDVTSRAADSDSVLDLGGAPVLVSTSAGTLVNLALAATPAFAPSGYQYDHGFFAFDITGLAPGGSATVTMTLPVGAAPTHYIKCGAAACALFGGATFAGRVVTLTLVDGGAGDSDNLANGTISDPGAPADITPPGSGGGGGGGGGGYGGGGALDLLAVGLGLLLAARRKRPSAHA